MSMPKNRCSSQYAKAPFPMLQNRKAFLPLPFCLHCETALCSAQLSGPGLAGHSWVSPPHHLSVRPSCVPYFGPSQPPQFVNAAQCTTVSSSGSSAVAAITTCALPHCIAITWNRRLRLGRVTPAACICRCRGCFPTPGHSYQRCMFAVRAIPPTPSIRRGGAGVLWWWMTGCLQAEAHGRMHRGGTDRARSGGSSSSTARLTAVVVGDKLGEGNVSRTASRAGTCRRENPKVSRARATMALLMGLKPWWVLRSEVCLHRLALAVR